MDQDDCSTDSGCNTGSGEHSSSECLCKSSGSPQKQCYLEQLQRRSARSHECLNTSVPRSSKCSLSETVRRLSHSDTSFSSYSFSSSDVQSSDSLKQSFSKTLQCMFQNLKIAPSKRENSKEKKHVKKSPKRILRNPVLYMYVRGLSGLPTQRVPRSTGIQQQTIQSYSCQNLMGLYR